MKVFQNEIAIVKGAGSGIGKEIAKSFAAEGVSIILAPSTVGRMKTSKKRTSTIFLFTIVLIINACTKDADLSEKDLSTASIGNLEQGPSVSTLMNSYWSANFVVGRDTNFFYGVGTAVFKKNQNDCSSEEGCLELWAGGYEGGAVDGPRTAARFYHIIKIFLAKDGNIFLLDLVPHKCGYSFAIRRVDKEGIVSTYAIIRDVNLWIPTIVMSEDGTFYFTTNYSKVMKIGKDRVLREIMPFEESIKHSGPPALAVTQNGNIYLEHNQTIRKFTSTGTLLSTIVVSINVDTGRVYPTFNEFLARGNDVYLACNQLYDHAGEIANNGLLMKLAENDRYSLIAGIKDQGVELPPYKDGPALQARLGPIENLTFLGNALYFLDNGYGRVRKLGSLPKE